MAVWGDGSGLKWEILHKEIEPDDADTRKGNLLQDIEIAVLTDDIIGIGDNGAVHKLVPSTRHSVVSWHLPCRQDRAESNQNEIAGRTVGNKDSSRWH